MYRIVCSDGTVLYDTSNPNNYMMTEPKCSREIGQAGGLSFAMLPAHPAYDDVQSMITYLSAYKDDEEIFYGRVIDTDADKTTGVKQVQCAGAIQFLDDSEYPPMSGSSGQSMTAEAFFRQCITNHNSDAHGDTRRTFTVGAVQNAKASVTKKYNISSYTRTKSAIETNLLNDYNGYLRVYHDNGVLTIDWIEDFGESSDSPIELGENVISQENAVSANDFYTAIRPVGKNGRTLPEGILPLSQELVDTYGYIVQSAGFNDASSEAALRSAANDFIARVGKGAGKTVTVKMVDMHFLDPEESDVRLGAVYTNIAGFDGEDMIVAAMESDFANPANDTVTLKNRKELTNSKPGAGGGGRGRMSGGAAKKFANIYNHIQETENSLTITAEKVALNAETLELHAQQLEETASEFARFSTETTAEFDSIKGTGMFQSSDYLSQIAGTYRIRYRIVSQAKLTGRNPQQAGLYEWHFDHVLSLADKGSGAELYANNQLALTGQPINTKTIGDAGVTPAVGSLVGHMVKTTDTTPLEGKTYYTRTYGIQDGTELYIDSEGAEINVYDSIQANTENILSITGSSLWTNRDGITGVVGEMEVHIDPETGERTLVIKSGGGMKVERDGVEYGLYDEYTLTGGLLVDKLNDGTVLTQIRGDRIELTSNENFSSFVQNVDDQFASIILQTSTMIRMEVSGAVSGIYGSVIEQTASYIRSEVRDAASAISQSVIEQTASYIRSEVSDIASGIAWSVVEQTMSGVIQQVARKAQVFVGMADPTTPAGGSHEVHEGDFWFRGEDKRTHFELEGLTYSEMSYKRLRDLFGSMVYIRQNGFWRLMHDEAAIREMETQIDQDAEHIALWARAVDLLQQEYNSNLTVTAQKISSDVSTAKSQLYSTIQQTATSISQRVANEIEGVQSSIEQTAYSIRLSVSASKSELWSVIEQTATNIRSQVADEIGGVQSTIEQTASSIRSEVSSAKSASFAKIEQTATSIRSEVSSAKSSLWSVINQSSTQISMKVGKGEVISSINQTAETVTILASRVNLSGYVTADMISADNIAAKISTVQSLTFISATAGSMSIGDLNANSISMLQSGAYTNIRNLFVNAITMTQSGNTYTLKYTKNSTETTIGSFSRAVNSATWRWVSGYPQVTLSPQDQKFNGTALTLSGIRYGTKTWASNRKSFDANFFVYDVSGNEPYNETLTVDTTVSWNDGYADGKSDGYYNAANNMTWPRTIDGRTDKTTVDIGYPTTGGGTSTRTLKLTRDSGGCYVQLGSQLILKLSS